MFEAEQAHIGEQIKAFCAQQGLPEPNLLWSWIPFSGQWGISTSFFQLASQEARQGKKVNRSAASPGNGTGDGPISGPTGWICAY